MKAERFFTEEEKGRIKKAVLDVEARTIGEIAVMVVGSSSQYIEAEVIGAIASGSLLSLIFTVLYFNASVWLYIPLTVAFFFPFWFLLRKVPILKTAFIGVRRKEDAVRQRALMAFYERGLYRTKNNTGVLFFLSVLERKVWILADKGIYERIGQERLDKFAMAVSQGIKDGCACDALCDAIKEAGGRLASLFPITKGDVDELPNNLMTE